MRIATGPLPPLVGVHGPGPYDLKHIPPGRWTCTEADAKAAYVPTTDKIRVDLWEEWQAHRDLVRSTLGRIAVCWLSGSLFTSKVHPNDIDCVYWLYAEDLRRLQETNDHTGLATLEFAFSNAHGLNVDAYPLFWDSHVGPARDSVERRTYVSDRGYWDDLWSRLRSTDMRTSTLPQRGYLEVVIDGYQ